MSQTQKQRLRKAALKWYDSNGRHLPWRQSADPYRVWLSEIMLQQTTVAAVVPYFERFSARFPNVQSLATADVDDVLRLWEGLGYYSRARNLHRAAQQIVRDFGGEVPADAAILLSLPGIGRYTAGAIASFAFDQPAAIVEANTERLYARLMALQDDVRSTAGQRRLWEFAASIVPRSRPGDFNQAMMDIGSQICRPADPACEICPLAEFCAGLRSGSQAQLPVRKPPVKVTPIHEVGIVLRKNGQFLLRRRTAQERWAGMWDFVRFEISDADIPYLPCGFSKPTGSSQRTMERSLFVEDREPFPATLQDSIYLEVGCRAGQVLAETAFTYSVTRYRVRLHCFLCDAVGSARSKANSRKWFAKSELGNLPLSKTGRQIADWLENQEV